GVLIGLVMHIIWSYFFDDTIFTLGFFLYEIQRKIYTLTAINSIMHHSEKSVLLCVNEIMKIDNKDHSKIIKLLASLYNPTRVWQPAIRDSNLLYLFLM